MRTEAAEYPHSTLNGTLTCSRHNDTALYEIHIASHEEFGCVALRTISTVADVLIMFDICMK